MTVVLPEKSVFFIDQDLSNSFKKNIEESIQKSYENSKNPQDVMNFATEKFPEISSMKIQICQADKICFYVDVLEPVFLLNNQFVVCDHGTLVEKDHFVCNVVQSLVQISCKKNENFQDMVHFVRSLPNTFKQEFLIEWNSDSNILLLPQNNKDCVLQCSKGNVLNVQDLITCRSIQANQKLKNKKRVVYDVRFKNQIIVR